MPEPATHSQVRIEPWDTKTIARASASVMQVRCLGTAGGCLGLVLGGFIGLVLGSATGSFVMAIIGVPLGAFAGAWLAIFLTFKLIARE